MVSVVRAQEEEGRRQPLGASTSQPQGSTLPHPDRPEAGPTEAFAPAPTHNVHCHEGHWAGSCGGWR